MSAEPETDGEAEAACQHVDNAIRARKVAPADRDWAEAYAAADPDGFADFVETAPALFGDEIGSDRDAPGPPDVRPEDEPEGAIFAHLAALKQAASERPRAQPEMAFLLGGLEARRLAEWETGRLRELVRELDKAPDVRAVHEWLRAQGPEMRDLLHMADAVHGTPGPRRGAAAASRCEQLQLDHERWSADRRRTRKGRTQAAFAKYVNLSEATIERIAAECRLRLQFSRPRRRASAGSGGHVS